jgi:hypothetical protein
MSSRQRYAIAVVGTSTLLIVVGFLVFLWRPALLTGITGPNLGTSIASEILGKGSGHCVELGGNRWRCRIVYETDPGSGGSALAHYVAKSSRSGCWQAGRRQVRAFSGPAPRHLSGCIDIFDL